MMIPPAILQPSIFAIEGSFYGELFDDTRLRFSGAALGRQLGNAIGGGTLPVIAAALLAANGGHISGPLWYYAALSGVSFVAVLIAHETKEEDLIFWRLQQRPAVGDRCRYRQELRSRSLPRVAHSGRKTPEVVK